MIKPMNGDYLLAMAAKWDVVSGKRHPLPYHMIDTGVVAQQLWHWGLTPGIHQRICEWLGLREEEVGRLLAYWASLHDIGKAAPIWQGDIASTGTVLAPLGFQFMSVPRADWRHHSLLSGWILDRHTDKLRLMPLSQTYNLVMALASHHGYSHTDAAFIETAYRRKNLGSGAWAEAQADLIDLMARLFDPPAATITKQDATTANAFFSILTGLVITADWLASNENLFGYQQQHLDYEVYLMEIAQPAAAAALTTTGWRGWQPTGDPLGFESLFPSISRNNIQHQLVELASHLGDPFLMILEAPTGSGKTEAALAIVDHCVHQHGLRGFYIAMPTQATSDQMYGRVKDYLRHRYPDLILNFHLVHGNALIQQNLQQIALSTIMDHEHTAAAGDAIAAGSINAAAWFTPRKLTLLAPFGVGTVDQTFLSVLQSRHFMLRLFGLARKVVVFDEVHAYDVYMVEIFKRLLAWLRAIGTSVILLSATLPASTRSELLSAYDPWAKTEPEQAPFPRVSLSTNGVRSVHFLGATPDRTVNLGFVERQPEAIVKVLRDKLSSGGCAAVICNTVKRAQEVYCAIKAADIYPPQDVLLFHARYPVCWRETRQNEVLSAFGRLRQAPMTPRRKIVVATQVIEQSLDLDFDFLISDLAPIDLLIQRVGRLQRHETMPIAPLRPALLSSPHCLVTMPEHSDDGQASFDLADRLVYEEVFLQRTYLILKERNSLQLPAETDSLIEAVYSDQPVAALTKEYNERLHKLYAEMTRRATSGQVIAGNQLIADVDYGDVFGGKFSDLYEDNPKAHQGLQVHTRDIRPSVRLVCLRMDEDAGLVTLAGNQPVDLHRAPESGALIHYLRSVIAVSDKSVVDHFLAQDPPKAWQKSGALRYHYPLLMQDGRGVIGEGLSFTLDPELGFLVVNN